MAGVSVLAVLLIGVVQWGGGALSGGPGGAKPMPAFSGESVAGSSIDSSAFAGKPLVVNLWASWCPPCRTEAPALAASVRDLDGKVQFVGIDVRDRRADAQAFTAEYGIPYASLFDPAGEVEARFAAAGVPVTVFVDSSGTIRRTWMGPIDEQRLLAFAEELD